MTFSASKHLFFGKDGGGGAQRVFCLNLVK